MPKAPLENVVAHWSKLYEGFQVSAKDFYTELEGALERRAIPDYRTSQVNFYEGSIFAPAREYLRVARERLRFDVCAAPFGKGFFFSWWLTVKPPGWVLLNLIVLAALAVVLVPLVARVLPVPLGILKWVLVLPLSIFLVLALVALASRIGWRSFEDAVVAVPLLGWVYLSLLSPPSFYRIDTTLMFQAAVHAAVLEVIEGLTAQKGLRGLTEEEKKPVFEKLL